MSRSTIVIVVLITLLAGFSGCMGEADIDEDRVKRNYRQDMREFVIDISQYGKGIDSDLIIVPQNGLDILSLVPDEAGPPAVDYMDAIDGLGQEDLFYGYADDDEATPHPVSERLTELLDLAEERGVEALVTDYCHTEKKMDDSYEKNDGRGYVSFAADHRELDNVPVYPAEPYNANSGDVRSLSAAKNFLYLLDPSGFGNRQDYLGRLKRIDHDILIIDLFYDGTEELTREEVASLKTKENGGERLVLAYISIGEAEDYRYYWDPEWPEEKPSWLAEENPNWKGNYKVRYWDENWREIIYGNDDSYVKKATDAGFDGIYLDIIDAFEYFEGGT